MTKLYKALLGVLLFPFFALAQSNYKPGSVVNLKGDTVHGFIDYKEWENNPKAITFKNSLNGDKSENYSTKNAVAFEVTGLEQYKLYIVSISTDHVELSKLAPILDTSAVMDTVFLKVITKGKYVALFRYTDDIKQRFFLLETGESQPKELIYHAYYDADKSSSVQYVNRYRNQLEYLAQKHAVNTGKLDGQILATNYNESELAKVVQIINGTPPQQYASQSLSGSRWFAGIGINYSTLNLTTAGGTSFNRSTTTNSSSVFPKITAGIDFFPNKNVQNLFLRTELSVTANTYNASNSNSNNTPQSTSSLNFTQYNSSITPQIIYNVYNKEQLKVFIGVGAALNFSAYNQYQYVTKYQGSLPDNVQDNYPAFDKFWLSFPIKGGITLNNKIEINLCYIPSSSLTNGIVFLGSVNAYQAGVNYLFGK